MWRIEDATSGPLPSTSKILRQESYQSTNLDRQRLERHNVKPVQCAPLAELLEPHLGPSFYFDFFSLDVEGAEFKVLKAIDLTKLGFGIILTEADAHKQRKNMALRTFIEGNGYSFYMEYERSYWFVNKKFWQIYSDRLFYMDEKAYN